MEQIDWAAAAAGAREKRFFGFSDATVLHSAIHAAATTDAATAAAGTGGGETSDTEQGSRLVTFHAPMIATGRTFVQLPSADLERFRAALFAPVLDSSLFPPLAGQTLYGSRTGMYRAMEGAGSRAVGVLIGGNLTTLASLCGGGWFANFGVGRGSHLGTPCPYILALEDENETAVRIDRHCRQLRMAGLLNDRDIDGYGAAGPGASCTMQAPKCTSAGQPKMAGLVLGRFDQEVPFPDKMYGIDTCTFHIQVRINVSHIYGPGAGCFAAIWSSRTPHWRSQGHFPILLRKA